MLKRTLAEKRAFFLKSFGVFEFFFFKNTQTVSRVKINGRWFRHFKTATDPQQACNMAHWDKLLPKLNRSSAVFELSRIFLDIGFCVT